MKAIIAKEYGPPEKLVYEEVADPIPAENEVLIAVKACGVNFPDTLIIRGLYQIKPPVPFSPGSDIAGVVESVGAKVTSFKVGDEVVALTSHGGFAEKVICPKNQVFPKPKGMSFIHGASFFMAYSTSYHALKHRAKIQKGETLLVLGASGGVGLTAVELGKLMGARVIAAASTQEKLDLCKKYGADETINYLEEDLKNRVKELTGGKGADVVYDPVGGKFTEAALRATNWNGRYLIIGFAAGDIPKIPMNLPLLKGCSIVGVFRGAFAFKEPKENLQMNKELLELFLTKKVNPFIQGTYPLEKTIEALKVLDNRKAMGKIVIEVG